MENNLSSLTAGDVAVINDYITPPREVTIREVCPDTIYVVGHSVGFDLETGANKTQWGCAFLLTREFFEWEAQAQAGKPSV